MEPNRSLGCLTQGSARHRFPIAEPILSAPAVSVTAYEQRSALGRNRRQQIPRSREDHREPDDEALAEGLTALTEAIRELDDKLEKIEKQVYSTRVR